MQEQASGLDTKVAFSGAIMSLVLLIYAGLVIHRLVYVLTAFSPLFSCLIWVKIRHRATVDWSFLSSKSWALLFILVFLVLFLTAAFSVYARPLPYERPPAFFFLIAAMLVVVGLEILVAPRGWFSPAILCQIIIIGLSLELSQSMLFPSVVGIDSMWHRMFVLRILESGSVPAGYAYTFFPMTHIDLASSALITGVDYKTSVMTTLTGVQVVIGTLVAFALGKRLFKSSRVGLLAGLLLSVANYSVEFGAWAIPNTYAMMILLLCVYSMTRLMHTKGINEVVLLLVLMFVLVLSHTLVAVTLGVILVLGLATFPLRRGFMNGTHMVLSRHVFIACFFFVFMLLWWSFAAGPFSTLLKILRTGFSLDAFYAGSRTTNYTNAIPFLEQLSDNLGPIVFFGLSLIGFFFALRRSGFPAVVLTTSGIAVLAVGFVSLTLGKEVLNERWWYAAEVLLSIPLAVSITVTSSIVKGRHLRGLMIIASVTAISSLMLITPAISGDCFGYRGGTSLRNGYMESELVAASFFSNQNGLDVSSDFYYATNPSSSAFANYYAMNYSHIISMDENLYQGNFSGMSSVIIIRQVVVRGLFSMAGGVYRLDYNLTDALETFGRAYDNGQVCAYTD